MVNIKHALLIKKAKVSIVRTVSGCVLCVCVCVSSLPLHAIQCNVNDEMERTIGLQQKSVEFQFKTGVQAKDYSSVAKKGNLKPIEVEVKRLEDTVSCITLFPPPPPSAPHLLFPPPPQ
jgi:hypothetical protein